MRNVPFTLFFWHYGAFFLLSTLLLAASFLALNRQKRPRFFWICWSVFMFGAFFLLMILVPWWAGISLLLPPGLLYGIVYLAAREAPLGKNAQTPPEDIPSEERPR